MLKKIGIFTGLFLFSITLLLVFNDDIEGDQLFDTTIYTSSIIDTETELIIHFEHNGNTEYDMDDAELSAFAESRIRVYESTDLTDSIEVYYVNLYGEIVEEAVITLNGNEITILSDLGPISSYICLTFLPYAQFDHSYFQGIPYRIYEIHIPEGLSYSIE